MVSLDQGLFPETFTTMLTSLTGWLATARQHMADQNLDQEAILAWQLASDMYPFSGQIRFACFLAQEPYYRLQGMEPPAALLKVREQGWSSQTHRGTLAEAGELLATTIGLLGEQDWTCFAEGANRKVVLELPDGHVFDMTGAQYLRDWALPQFHFHVNTAYAILRHKGIALGKRDYLPHMFGYLRAARDGS